MGDYEEEVNTFTGDKKNDRALTQKEKDDEGNNDAFIIRRDGEKYKIEDKEGKHVSIEENCYPVLPECNVPEGKKTKTRKTEKEKWCYHAVVLIFILLDLFLLILIIIYADHMCSEREQQLSRDIAPCLPCKDLRIHPDDVIKNVSHKGDNNETCCMKDTEDYDALLSYFVDRWLKEKLTKDDRQFTRYQCKDDSISGSNTPVIKLIGTEVKQKGEHKTVFWDKRSDAAILSDTKDIIYHKESGFIEIKKAGLYQIYTQIVFGHDRKSHSLHHLSNIYQHHVIRIKAERPESDDEKFAIMKSSNTYCSCEAADQTVTSFLGGVFQLSKGDKLAVTVRNKTEVVPVAHKNFFGVHML